jgi:flagellar biosynthesis/type III secretory pathway M-ring protein FliF/YscJ
VGDATRSDVTGPDGFVTFRLSAAAVGMDVTVILEKDGYKVVTHNTRITTEMDLEQSVPAMKVEPGEEEGPPMYLVAIIVVLLIILVVMTVIGISRRRRGTAPIEDTEGEDETGASEEPTDPSDEDEEEASDEDEDRPND